MKAIVLTCDRYRAITEHMMLKYGELWPDHPFVFRIPYQELGGNAIDRCEFVKTPSAIRATALELIAGLEDDEWVYWCVDDKYPIELALPKIREFVAAIQDLADASGLLFCRSKALLRRADETLF